MKTTLMSAAFLILTVTGTYAQAGNSTGGGPSSLAKGSLLLGANGTGSFGTAINGKSRAYLVSPWAGYLLQDKLVTGLALTFSGDKYSSKDTSVLPDKNLVNVSPEVFARYYLLSGKLKPFAQLGAGYNFLTFDGEKRNGAYLSPAAGLSYLLGQRVALEANYTLKMQSQAMKQVDPAADLKFRLGFSVGIR